MINTRADIDPGLLDLVRTIDPMRDARVRESTGLDTESALRRLAPQLDPASTTRGAEQRRPWGAGRRRRTTLRTVVLAGALAAVVFVVANVASTGTGSSVAQAQTVLRHVRAALLFPPHAIYEEETVSTATARDGATHTDGWHEWLSTSAPYNNRIIEFANGKVLWEQAFVNGRLDLYDPTRNTIYLAPKVTDKDVVGCKRCSGDSPQSTSELSEVAYLLKQRNVKMNRDATLDGKRAIEITTNHGRFSFWISPRTYKPLQVEDRDDSLPDGQPAIGISRYPIVRVLSGSAASPKLLSLQAQHPHAIVNHSRKDYAAAHGRLIHDRGAQT